MASEARIKKINALIKREVGQMILEELEFPAGVFATLTNVDTSLDLTDSKIEISVFPASKLAQALKILDSQAGHLQHLLNRKLSLHFVPRIRFVPDKALGNAQKVEEILENIKIEDTNL
ncbi:MAG: 30S ribosome-binding factor RbfA [Candidatus Pacebacteria bacterium]|nr:30S ribosome-binding factor RbfA [Candidatus Paceibacterota bacterium]